MPAHNGWVLDAAGKLFWSIYDAFPDFRHRLRVEISGEDNGVYVYFRATSPPAVLKFITPRFFGRHNLRFLSWVPVFRRLGGNGWEAFNENSFEHHALGGVDFGWRYRESVLPGPMSAVPDREEGAKRIVSHFPLTMIASPPHGPTEIEKAEEPRERPAFLRKVMD